jgi:hypothetical protein
MAKCQVKLDNGKICSEELVLEENIGKENFGQSEPPIHHAEGSEDAGGYSHHSCRLGHAWHRYMKTGLLTPCDCTGHARGAV